jgi:hypothetical protein
MKNIFLTLLLLAVTSCNPVKRLQKSQAELSRIVDAANNRTAIIKDSIVYAPGKTDSAFFVHNDTLTHTVTNEYYYHTRDTLRYYIQDAALLTSARRTADISAGRLEESEKIISEKQKDRNTLFLICLGEALAIGIIIFLKFKL